MATESPMALLLGGGHFVMRLTRYYDIYSDEVIRSFRRAQPSSTHRKVLFAIRVTMMVGDILYCQRVTHPERISSGSGHSTSRRSDAAHETDFGGPGEDIHELIATIIGMHRQIYESPRQLAWLNDCMEQVL
ncbi:hypothetical protein L1887_38996 [Cichorium endivia]|nr:hypothetical protein L1887_38996 [Cichorium endivia]